MKQLLIWYHVKTVSQVKDHAFQKHQNVAMYVGLQCDSV